MDTMAGVILSRMVHKAAQNRAGSVVKCRTVQPDADPNAFLINASKAIAENNGLSDEAKTYAASVMVYIFSELTNGQMVDAETIHDAIDNPSNLLPTRLTAEEKSAIAELLIDAHHQSCTLGDSANEIHAGKGRT